MLLLSMGTLTWSAHAEMELKLEGLMYSMTMQIKGTVSKFLRETDL